MQAHQDGREPLPKMTAYTASETRTKESINKWFSVSRSETLLERRRTSAEAGAGAGAALTMSERDRPSAATALLDLHLELSRNEIRRLPIDSFIVHAISRLLIGKADHKSFHSGFRAIVRCMDYWVVIDKWFVIYRYLRK